MAQSMRHACLAVPRPAELVASAVQVLDKKRRQDSPFFFRSSPFLSGRIPSFMLFLWVCKPAMPRDNHHKGLQFMWESPKRRKPTPLEQSYRTMPQQPSDKAVKP